MAKYHAVMYNAVASADQGKLGVQFGAACIDAQIPVQVVARWLNITRQGVYYWFTGVTDIDEKHRAKVKHIIAVLLSALDAGDLPTRDLDTAMTVIAKYREQLK